MRRMQRENENNNQEPNVLSSKIGYGFLAVLIVVGLLYLGWFAKQQTDAIHAVATQRAALIQKQNDENAKAAKIAAAKAKKNKKGKKMVQIPAGSTGQADLVGTYPGAGTGIPAVSITQRGGGTSVSGGNVATDPFPQTVSGWTVDSDGTVSPPSDATAAIYDMEIQTDAGGGSYDITAYEFEVIVGDPPAPTSRRRGQIIRRH